MRLEIEFVQVEEGSTTKMWRVSHGDKYVDGLDYCEMLGLVAAITMPEQRPSLHWLKTATQHQEWKDKLIEQNKVIY